MRTLVLLLAAFAAVPALTSAQEDGVGDELLRLRDGRMLFGPIVEHDLDGLVVESARTGGRLRLAWADLFPGEADRLRRAFGYRVETSVPTVSAHRILLKNGRELVGRIVRRDARGLEVRVRDTSTVVPASMLAAPPEPVTVEAVAILTPQQFYAERAPQVPEDDRLAQYEFARELESVFALEEARRHYERAAELAAAAGDRALQRRVEGALRALEVKIANRAEAEYLERVRVAMNRERFEQAEELLEAYEETFPEARLRGEWVELKDALETKRDLAIRRYLARNWYNRAVSLLQRKALDRESTMATLMMWAEAELPKLVRERLVGELVAMDDELAPEDLDAYWAQRFEERAVRHKAGYGDGTWILGSDKARAGLDEEEEADDGKTDAQREMEDRVNRYLRNLENQRRASAGARTEAEATPEDWWRKASVTERFQWLLAYYGEFSGDFQVASVHFRACPTCAGLGYVTTMDLSTDGAKERRAVCPTCHGVGVRRSVTFR